MIANNKEMMVINSIMMTSIKMTMMRNKKKKKKMMNKNKLTRLMKKNKMNLRMKMKNKISKEVRMKMVINNNNNKKKKKKKKQLCNTRNMHKIIRYRSRIGKN